MAANVEIKARLDDPERVRDAALAAGARPHAGLRQVDTFFHAPRGRLKLRDFTDGTGELIGYRRADEPGPKPSEYHRLPTASPDRVRGLLSRALGVRGVVTKAREVLLLGRTRIHLDRVEGLGSFLELEVVLDGECSREEGERIALDLMERLGVSRKALVACAYIDLLDREG